MNAVFTLAVAGVGVSASADSILGITTEAAGGDSNLINLTSVTLDRDGATVFLVDELIGIQVQGFDSAFETLPFEGAVLGTPDLPGGPAAGSRAALLDGDTAINTGINNPSEDEGILFSFLSPVVNGPGADLVIFEFGAPEGAPIPSDPSGNTLAPPGDPFVLTGVTDEAGSPIDASRTASFGSDAISLTLDDGFASDIFFFNPGPGTDFSDLDTLENGELALITPPGATSPTAFDLSLFGAAVDLSDLGFADGELVSTLRLLAQGPTFAIDPSFIAGLPVAAGASTPSAVPTPSAAIMGAPLLIASWVRRRRRA